jgi:hypothetical protein
MKKLYCDSKRRWKMVTLEQYSTRTGINNALACPHCGAGHAEATLGLFWDIGEEAWRCIFCGYRSFERKHRTFAQIMEDRLWDKVLGALEEEPEGLSEEAEEEVFAEKVYLRAS